MYVSCIFCELVETFDCVNHKLLLLNLPIMVYRVKFSDWFKSYLCTRNSGLNLNHQKHNFFSPSWDIFKRGVPQGLVLFL